MPLWLCLLCSVWFWGAAWAAVDVVDDSGQRIRLAQPAQRIISLAPHITELLYEIGAGEKIVGTVEYSDYPPDAKAIPRIGRHNALDLETVVMLKPDIVIAWQSGNPVHHVEKIMSLGIPVYFSEPVKLPDVADTLKRFGQLAGLAANAQQAQRQYIQRYQRLKQSNQHKSKVRVFYEIWNRPMMSINGKHIVNEVIELCGGDNVFKTLRPLTPTVDVEAVIKVDPEVIIASGVGEAPPPWLGEWDAWPQITAVKKRQVYHINPDYIHRQTSRILIGAERLCALLDKARKP
ncbi:MAG: ABC transporter substrate-binding protein [Gammaproteobacteria bacterium SG8_11]|nr:MAG: ABC transporter substrate-binding protein [Gammaproteobacteria bacterium SG8_11]